MKYVVLLCIVEKWYVLVEYGLQMRWINYYDYYSH